MKLIKGKKYYVFAPAIHANGIIDSVQTDKIIEGIVKATGIIIVGYIRATGLTQYQFFEVEG